MLLLEMWAFFTALSLVISSFSNGSGERTLRSRVLCRCSECGTGKGRIQWATLWIFFSPAVQFQQFSVENSCGALGFIIMRMNFRPIFIRIEIRMLSPRRIFLEKSLASWEREDYRMCAHLKKKKKKEGCMCVFLDCIALWNSCLSVTTGASS